MCGLFLKILSRCAEELLQDCISTTIAATMGMMLMRELLQLMNNANSWQVTYICYIKQLRVNIHRLDLTQ